MTELIEAGGGSENLGGKLVLTVLYLPKFGGVSNYHSVLPASTGPVKSV